jgi:hypothetical protein
MPHAPDQIDTALTIRRTASEGQGQWFPSEPWLVDWVFRECYRELYLGLLLVVDKCEPAVPDKALEKLRAALCLILDADPKRLARARLDVRFILLGNLHVTAAKWSIPFKACIMDVATLVRTPTPLVSVMLVHEFTHARLWHAGIRIGRGVPERVEKACIKQELHFVARLPSGEEFLEPLNKRLSTVASTIAGKHSRNIEFLRREGLPQWVALLLVTITEAVYAVVVRAVGLAARARRRDRSKSA